MSDAPPNVTTASGNLPDIPYGGNAPGYPDPETGMHSDYWVLTEAERAKGFSRPFRRSYKHKDCGAITTMASAIAETFARKPSFYRATFCSFCKSHEPLNEFVWVDDGDEVGS